MRKKILFVGSFLSHTKGTQSVAEKVSGFLGKYYDVTLVSHYSNQVLRLLDIVFAVCFKSYDVVHIDVFSGKAFVISDVASRIAKLKNKKIVMTLHGGRLHEFYVGNEKRFSDLFSRADTITSPSKFLIDFFANQGVSIVYLPNFIDIDKFAYRGVQNRELSLLWVRAFTDVYHPELAIETLKKLKSRFPDLRLVMVGPDKGTLKRVQELAGRYQLQESIDFVGKVANDALSTYYQTSSVYLNTTRYESFGIAVVEAAACGIPIVSTEVGEIPYLWKDGEEILILEERTPECMASQVEKILTSHSLAEKLSDNARMKAMSLDWKQIEKQWTSLFTELLATKDKYVV